MNQPHSPIEPVTSDEKQQVLLMWVIAIVVQFVAGLGIISPIIYYFMYKDKSKFIAFYSAQGIWLYIWVFAIVIIAFLLGFAIIFVFPPLAFLFFVVGGLASLVAIIASVIALIKSQDGQWYDIPLVGPSARKMAGL
jgi:uncharacterized membrane protein